MEKKCQEYLIKSVEEMQHLAVQVADSISGGTLLLLTGDLGAGKTTFVKALGKALDVSQDISSPTFTIVAEYEVTNHMSIKHLVHVDLYRLNTIDHFITDILEDSSNPDTLTAIEWADKLSEKPPQALNLHFSVGQKDNERQVTICS